MADLTLTLGFVLAVLGLALGSRSSAALLASLIVTTGLDWLGFRFVFGAWLAFDVVVALVIIRRDLPRTDIAVLALFPVAWTFYFAAQPWQFWGAMLAVLGQLMLSVPWQQAWRRARSTPMPPIRNPFDMREAATDV